MRGSWLPGSVVLALTIGTACHHMRPVETSRLNPADLPQRLWVTGPDRSTVILNAPRINGDTLGGWVAGEYREFSVSQATAIRTREPAPTRTAILVTATSVMVLSTFIYMQGRKDVGNAPVCLNAAANMPAPFTPCCLNQDTMPC
jgi:hypothetical protein